MRVRSALVYTVLRLAVFLVPFGLMMLVPVLREHAWLSAIFAALIGLSLSLLFLQKPRDELTADLAARRARSHRVTDEDTEDAVIDEAADSAEPAGPAGSADEGPEQERTDGQRGQ